MNHRRSSSRQAIHASFPNYYGKIIKKQILKDGKQGMEQE